MLEYKGSVEFIGWLTFMQREGWRNIVNTILYRTTTEQGAEVAKRLMRECKLQEYGWGEKDFAGRDLASKGSYKPGEAQGELRCLGCQTIFTLEALNERADYMQGVCPPCGGLLASVG